MVILKLNLGWVILLIIVLAVFLYKRSTKNKEALTSKFTAKQILPLNINASLQMSRQALQNARFKKVGLDSNENRLYAQSGFSMASWSEFIQVKAKEINGQTELEFKSLCAFPAQIFDWGKNKRNYERFKKELSKLTRLSAF